MDIIAQRWKTPGNIGALARAMKNFEFEQMVLLNPDCDHLCKEAMDRSTQAKQILHNAQVVERLEYDILIGTTSALGSSYNVIRNPITAEQLAQMELKGKVGLIIGREGDGLTNEELEKCDIVVTIPTAKSYPVMNVSHAATVLMYEIFKHSNQEKVTDHIDFATKEDKERLENLFTEIIEKMPFINEHKKRTQRLVWKKLIGKSNLTKKEMMSLYGFIRRIK
jgi:tRNA/rRNA methyltransferase